MTASVNIGIIGTGRIGQIHASNLTRFIPDATVVAVSDVVEAAAVQCAAELGIDRVEKNYDQILTSPEVDAVLICSPTDTHAQIIVEAAQAGKHIFCEKPIALDLATIDKALTETDAAKVKFQIGFNRRFDPGMRHAREAVVAGKVGTPHLVRITSRDPAPPSIDYVKASGGLFVDMSIHDFDMSRFILGEEIKEIFAVGGTLINPEIEAVGDIDTALITLSYQTGAFGTIDNSRQAVYGYDQRLEVFGSEGCIIVGNRTPHEGRLYTRQGIQDSKPLYFFLERYQESFLEEMRHFISAIRNDTQPLVVGRDARIPMVMALAAQKSLSQGKPIEVEIPE